MFLGGGGPTAHPDLGVVMAHNLPSWTFPATFPRDWLGSENSSHDAGEEGALLSGGLKQGGRASPLCLGQEGRAESTYFTVTVLTTVGAEAEATLQGVPIAHAPAAGGSADPGWVPGRRKAWPHQGAHPCSPCVSKTENRLDGIICFPLDTALIKIF